MRFWRIVNDNLHDVGEVERLGFDEKEPSFIPDEYLNKQIFTICRTCLGIGDWGVLSAMPRLLKQKFPNCVVQIPSQKLLKHLFEPFASEWLKSWKNPYETSEFIFRNNPYVDAFVDNVEDEIFHDHYRIYDENNDKIPLLEQMLKFWQFKKKEYLDSTPDIYFSKEEKSFGNKILGSLKDFGYISVSSTYGTTANTKVLRDKIKEYGDITWFYYGENPIEDTDLNFIKKHISVKPMNLNIRQQMYLKCQAIVNVGNETGMALWGAKYSDTYVLGNKVYGPNHGGKNEGKLRKRPFKSGNFVNKVNYLT